MAASTRVMAGVAPHGQRPWYRQARPSWGDLPPTRGVLEHDRAHGRRPWAEAGLALALLACGTARAEEGARGGPGPGT